MAMRCLAFLALVQAHEKELPGTAGTFGGGTLAIVDGNLKVLHWKTFAVLYERPLKPQWVSARGGGKFAAVADQKLHFVDADGTTQPSMRTVNSASVAADGVIIGSGNSVYRVDEDGETAYGTFDSTVRAVSGAYAAGSMAAALTGPAPSGGMQLSSASMLHVLTPGGTPTSKAVNAACVCMSATAVAVCVGSTIEVYDHSLTMLDSHVVEGVATSCEWSAAGKYVAVGADKAHRFNWDAADFGLWLSGTVPHKFVVAAGDKGHVLATDGTLIFLYGNGKFMLRRTDDDRAAQLVAVNEKRAAAGAGAAKYASTGECPVEWCEDGTNRGTNGAVVCDMDSAVAYNLWSEGLYFAWIDVRDDSEWSGSLGHVEGTHQIAGIELDVTLAPEGCKDVPTIVSCDSGFRSGPATDAMGLAGFSCVFNYPGMVLWGSWNYPAVKDAFDQSTPLPEACRTSPDLLFRTSWAAALFVPWFML